MFVCVCLCVCVCVGGLLIEAPPRAIWDVLTNYNQVFFYLYFQFCFIFFKTTNAIWDVSPSTIKFTFCP